MIDRLKSWDILPQISIFFAGFLSNFDSDERVLLAAALIARALTENHIGVPLGILLDRFQSDLKLAGIDYNLPAACEVSDALLKSRSCGRPGEYKPLILDKDRLYLERYYHYEIILSERLRYFSRPIEISDNLISLLKKHLGSPEKDIKNEFDPLKAAVFLSAVKGLSVISGGPGTGKTTALISILNILLKDNPSLKIILAAPTGKASERILEILSGKIPVSDSGTVHRLVQLHGKKIDADVLVIDEASMLSLPLMTRVISLLNDSSRLILLGDRNQLSSVEAGAFFADLIDASSGNFSNAFYKRYLKVTGQNLPFSPSDEEKPLSDTVIELEKSYRFPDDSLIGKLAKLVISGTRENASNALTFLNDNSGLTDKYGITIFRRQPIKDAFINQDLEKLVIEGYRPFIEENDISAALEKFGKFRVLCALNTGPSGVEDINDFILKILEKEGLLLSSGLSSYENKPVIITQNDYSLGLYNGDTGLTRKDGHDSLRVHFRDHKSRSLRSFIPAFLPHLETAFAMTVHKSQGSEFDSIALLLPFEDSRVLTRELLYTGITRVRKTIHIFTGDEVFKNTILRKTKRFSGLSERLRSAQ